MILTALARATKPFSIKWDSRNSRAGLCKHFLSVSVCCYPLRKYDGSKGWRIYTQGLEGGKARAFTPELGTSTDFFVWSVGLA
jgi:hypothetical protein